MKIQIMLEVAPPAPGKQKYPVPDKEKDVESEIREALDCIESGHDSLTEWKLINRMYTSLKNKKDERSKNLVKMMEPTLSKYGVFGVAEE